MATTINGDLLVTGSVVANQNVQAAQIESANLDVGAGRNVTAINDVVAANNVEAGNIVSANKDVGAGRNVVAQNDVFANFNLIAQQQPTAVANTATMTPQYDNTSLPASQPGLQLQSTGGNQYVLFIDDTTIPNTNNPKPTVVIVQLT